MKIKIITLSTSILLSCIAIGQNLNNSKHQYIAKIVRLNAMTGLLNNQYAKQYNYKGEFTKENIDILYSFIDSIPIEIIDSLTFENVIVGVVGLPVFLVSKESIQSFFKEKAKKYYRSDSSYYWINPNLFHNAYFAFDKINCKFYKLKGYRHSDIYELYIDLKMDGAIKNKKDFHSKTSSLNSYFETKQLMKKAYHSFKKSFYVPRVYNVGSNMKVSNIYGTIR